MSKRQKPSGTAGQALDRDMEAIVTTLGKVARVMEAMTTRLDLQEFGRRQLERRIGRLERQIARRPRK